MAEWVPTTHAQRRRATDSSDGRPRIPTGREEKNSASGQPSRSPVESSAVRHRVRRRARTRTQIDEAAPRRSARPPPRGDRLPPRRGGSGGGAGANHQGVRTFWVGAESSEEEAPRRFAVPVTLLGHPRILELLVEAQERYGYAHDGAIVVPCGVERFQKAVDAASAQERHRRHHYHHHHFRIPHLAACFRPSHIVA